MAKGKTAQGTVRKSTKGIPRVTDKVLAMSEADRKAWLAKVTADKKLSSEVVVEIEKRIVEGLATPRTPKVKKVDFGTIFNGRSVSELGDAQTALNAALDAAVTEEEARIQAIYAKAEKELAIIKARKSGVAAPASA